jgi:3-deoxy-7-phosphoheptulonate synthase / chorismate mutase
VTDDVVAALRDEITALDRALVETVNRRLEIVRRLHDHKVEHNIPLRDPAREQSMAELLRDENRGPLSDGGLSGFYRYVLDLTRRELHGE